VEEQQEQQGEEQEEQEEVRLLLRPLCSCAQERMGRLLRLATAGLLARRWQQQQHVHLQGQCKLSGLQGYPPLQVARYYT